MPNGRISPRGRGGGKGWTRGFANSRAAGQRLQDSLNRSVAAAGDERRGSVYRDDVEFTGTDAADPLPPVGPQRDALVGRLRELRATGLLSQREIAEQLGIDISQVGYLCQRHKIKKG